MNNMIVCFKPTNTHVLKQLAARTEWSIYVGGRCLSRSHALVPTHLAGRRLACSLL